MIVLDIGIAACGFAFLVSALRIAIGPTAADRAIAADLLTFSIIGLIALVGTKSHSQGTFDLVLVGTLVAFLAAVSLARALTRGHR